MKFIFLILISISAINANKNLVDCIVDSGVDPDLVKRIELFGDYQHEEENLKKYVLCNFKTHSIINSTDLEKEKLIIQKIVSEHPDLKDVTVCQTLSGETLEDLAWNLAKCRGHSETKEQITYLFSCADKLGVANKFIRALLKKDINFDDEKFMNMFVCFFEKMGWINNDGKIIKKQALATVDDKLYNRYGKYIDDCNEKFGQSEEYESSNIIKCLIKELMKL